jgi:hypothetical protein
MKSYKIPKYRIKLLDSCYFPNPVKKDDFIIFNDSSEMIVDSVLELYEISNQLKSANIKHSIKVILED